MAYVANFNIKEENAAVAAHTASLPSHVTNDLLLVKVTKDGTGTLTCSTSGWGQVGSTQSSGAHVSAVFFKVAASGSETNPQIDTNTADGFTSLSIIIKDADTTNPIDNSVLSSNAAASQFTQAAVTPNTADCLILFLLGIDGSASSALSNPGVHFLTSGDNAGTTYGACLAAAWSYQRAASVASPSCGWTMSLSEETNRFTISIKNKSGGRIPAYLDGELISAGTVVALGNHFSALNGISFPVSLSLATVASKTTAYDVAAATADYGINPYSAALAHTPGITAASNLTGFQIDFTASKDFDPALIMGSIIGANPRDSNYDMGTIAEGGLIVVFLDTNNYYRAYQALARNSKPNSEGRMVWCIQPSQSGTAIDVSGSALNDDAVLKMMFLMNCPRAAATVYHCEIHQVGTFVVAGGDATYPIDDEDVAIIGSSFRLPVIQKSGASSLLSYAPIQIGGGDAVNFQVDAGALQFPRIYSVSKNEINYHADVKKVGISYAGKSGDVIKHTNSIITSPSEYYWEIKSGATSAAAWDFFGLTVVGAFVTLRNVMTFTGMTFASCTSIDATGCSLDGCTITKVPSTNDSLLLDSSSNIDNCTIDVRQVSSGNRLCSVG